MKTRLAIAGAWLVWVAATQAETQTLVQGDYWQAWAKPEIKATTIGSDTAGIGGVQLGSSLSRNLYLGVCWYALLNSVSFDDNTVKMDGFDVWYAGGVANYTFLPEKVVHPAATIVAAGGSADGDLAGGRTDHSSIFVLEPSIEVLVNITKNLELGINGGYRFVSGSDIQGVQDQDLGGPTAGLFIRWTE